MLQLQNWANFLSIENNLWNNNEIVLGNLTRHVFGTFIVEVFFDC